MEKFIVAKTSNIDKKVPCIIIGQYIIIPTNINDYAMTTQLTPSNPKAYQLNGQGKSP